jgi:enamine deaminase RidA (YjgF/YER057c/UK114 family)
MITRHHSSGRLSQAVEYPLSGTMVVTSGVTAGDPTGSIEAQTKNVLDKIDGFLAEAGTDKHHLSHVYVWLANIADFAAMNTVYDAWVSADNKPARACVETRLADPRLKVEIQVFAVK